MYRAYSLAPVRVTGSVCLHVQGSWLRVIGFMLIARVNFLVVNKCAHVSNGCLRDTDDLEKVTSLLCTDGPVCNRQGYTSLRT